MEWDKTFNHHRWWALLLLVMASIAGWYSLILMTNPTHDKPIPDPAQWIALGVTILIAFIAWFSKCLTIIPY